MKRRMLFLVLASSTLTGCYESRVKALETKVATLETEHTKTRDKLQELLLWVNKKEPPGVGLVNWIDAVHAKVFPGPGDGSKPPAPPPPF